MVSRQPIINSDAVVEETVAEINAVDRSEPLAKRLVRFGALYKIVFDTLVNMSKDNAGSNEKADHRYPQLTPEAVRGLTVTLNWEGKKEVITSPLFGNSHDMKLPDNIAIIGVMKVRKEPFFLWLLGLFSRGAIAPPDVKPAAGSPGRSARRKRSRSTSLPPVPPVCGAPGPDGRGETSGATTAAGRAAGTTSGAGETGDGGNGSRSTAVVAEIVARFVMQEGRVVAAAYLHPEWGSFHSAPTPVSVVPGFLREVADGCGGIRYPFWKDPVLCLESRNPAAPPVLLSEVGTSYKIAWPIELVGYVCGCSHYSVVPSYFSRLLAVLIFLLH